MAAGLADLVSGNDAWASSVQQLIQAANEGFVLDQSFSNTTGAFTTNATFATSVTFTVTGDRTTTYVPGRRLRIVHGGGTTYTEVGSSSFSSPTTTITIGAVNSGPTTLTTPITSVAFALAYPSMTTGNYTHALPWQLLSRTTTTVVASTATATSDSTMFTYTIPAALLGSSGVLRLSCYGDFLNNSGGDIRPVWKFVIGTSTVIAMSTGDAAGAITSNASRRHWDAQIVLQNAGSASAQRVYGTHGLTAATTQASFGLFAVGSTDAVAARQFEARGYGTATEATTAATVISYIMRLASTNAGVDANLFHAVLEYCP